MTVSVPDAVMVGEGDGMVTVCVVLYTTEATKRSFTVTVATLDGAGTSRKKVQSDSHQI